MGTPPAAGAPIRLTAVMSHPIQYMAPLFRHIAAQRPDLDLTVVYVTIPTPAQQGTGFGVAFTWDVPLLEGYRWRVCRRSKRGDRYDRFTGLDDPHLPSLVLETEPDVVLVGGWHFAAMLRTVLACRRAGVPVVYRGDSSLLQAPAGALRRRAWEVRTRRLLGLFDGFLAVGTRSREYLQHFGAPPRLTFDSPHCVDAEAFARLSEPHSGPDGRAAARAELGIAPDAFVCAFVGKLEPQKRPLDLVRAAARAERPVSLLFAGSGGLEGACRAEARRLGVRATFAGFVNQGKLGGIYAAADVLALPSEGETWGLVVNEAMASGVPCIVSDGVGCGPDMIVPGVTGEVFPAGDPTALACSIERVRARRESGHDPGPACRLRARAHSVARAAEGIVAAAAACAPLGRRAPRATARARVVAVLGEFTILGGLERMTLEVLRSLRGCGARVHCIVKDWEQQATIEAVQALGASHSESTYHYRFARADLARPRLLAGLLRDIGRTSWDLLRESGTRRATHVLSPTHLSLVRNAPALLVARTLGVRSTLRLGTAPAPGRLHAVIWRWLIDPLVDDLVCNSYFSLRELLETGISARKARVIYNCLREGTPETAPEARRDGRVLFVGQVIPEKGLLQLLEAVALVARSDPTVSLDVIGRVEGWEQPAHAGYMERVRRRADEPDLFGRVRFLGWREDAPTCMRAAAVHCCPSQPDHRESFANVCIEAKAAGVPSVVTPSGGLLEAVRHERDGWICRGFDAAALAEGILHFLAAPLARDAAGLAAREDFERRFARARFDREWLSVFDARARPSLLARRLPATLLPAAALLARGRQP
ncbi:MAG: glycosyltransferase family 4 protein [Planctomycetota bacterium]|nr:glycosyltransferase family 4 protein [Planctomycetota bacterium]